MAKHFHDLGKLLLTFVMLWAYFAFSQLLIIWAGNLPEEISFYMPRFVGPWRWIGLTMIVFEFALPFVLLLSRDLKRQARGLAMVTIILPPRRWKAERSGFVESSHSEICSRRLLSGPPST